MEYAGLFTQAELNAEGEAGYVRSNVHPDDPEMWILNYTEKAAYESHWNNVTLNCRGLIIGPFSNIIARPFPKFFNYGQAGCPEIDLDEPAIVSDKMDGSLGILYRFDGPDWRIATRGSFTSDQAIHATEILKTKYTGFKPVPNVTYLFEIIYPENRIVCDYAGMNDLVLIGVVDTNTGQSCSPTAEGILKWPGPVTEVFSYESVREAIAVPPRAGKEGFVVHLLDSDVRVKIKQEDYCKLHAALSHLSSYSIWSNLSEGKSVEEILKILPDETHTWVKDISNRILEAKDKYISSVVEEFNKLGKKLSRKDFAFSVLNLSNKAALFNLYDDKSIEEMAWKNVKPSLITLGEPKDKLYAVPSN